MSKTGDESYKTGFERYQRITAFLVHRAGGEVTINQCAFLTFPDGWALESTLNIETGDITLATRYDR